MCIAGGQFRENDARFGASDAAEDLRAPLRQFAVHQHLFFEGDPKTQIYVVASGWVKLYRTLIDGQRQVVAFANAGSVLGLECDGTHLNACEAITPVTVKAIPTSRIHDLCLKDGAFMEQLLTQLGRQLAATQAQLAAVGAQSAEQKLATFLLSIARLNGARSNEPFELPMRRGEMGEFLGLRLETISRKMSEFQRRGWIRMTSLYQCQILKPGVLQDLADGGEALSQPPGSGAQASA